MKRIFNKAIVALLSAVFYITFTGLMTELTLLTGLVATVAIAILLEPILIKRELKLRDALRIIHLFEYIVYLITIELKEHLSIAKLVFRRSMSVKPEVVKIPFDLETDYGITLLASTITNTPGTITLHIDRARKTLYIHWLTPKTRDPQSAKREIVGRLEDIIKRVLE